MFVFISYYSLCTTPQATSVKNYRVEIKVIIIIRCIFPSFSLGESPPRDLQITANK